MRRLVAPFVCFAFFVAVSGLYYEPPKGFGGGGVGSIGIGGQSCFWWRRLECPGKGARCNSDTICPGQSICCLHSCDIAYCTTPPPRHKDPCQSAKCAHGEVCVVDGNRARCLCPPRCVDKSVKRVCGTDGITYKNLCELMRTACIIGDTKLTKKQDGRCGSKPPTQSPQSTPSASQPPPTTVSVPPPQSTLKVSPQHRANQELIEGKSGSISCRFDGNVLFYLWTLPNANPLPSHMREAGNVLQIDRVSREDSGVYSCMATGGTGGSEVVRAQVTVTVKPQRTNLCDEPLSAGNCTNYKVRWYFNKNNGECVPFLYTGCEGNSNNFFSKDKCESMCKRQDVPDNRVCPATRSSSTCAHHSSNSSCSSNDDCVDGKKCCTVECCSGSCRKECIKPVLPDKMGVCPAPIEDRSDCSTECSVDHDCDGELKCCQQPCGRICVEPDMKGEACKAVVDVAFLLDSSGSISRRNWKLLLDFLRDSIEAFDVTASGSHVASISYSSRAVVNFRFNTLTGDKLTSAELIKEVDKIKHQRGYTYIDRALLLADKEIFTERGGMRQAVRKVAFLITDGMQTKSGKKGPFIPLVNASQPLKDKGVDVWAIGIGKRVNVSELQVVASDPKKFILLSSFKEMKPIIEELKRIACKEEKETTKCQKEYLAATKNPVPGRFVPRCDLDGSYADVQCSGSVCYCVDKETGGEVTGTRTSIETGRPVCKEPYKLTPCQEAYKEAVQNPNVGAYIPRCKDDGAFESIQCEGGSGHCWCVDQNGNEIQGTRTTKNLKCPDPATQPNYTDCQRRYIERSKNSVSGQYIPWCRPDGSYYWRQCYDSYCFCVDTSGREITKTRVHSSNGVPKCSENGGVLTPCQISALQERVLPSSSSITFSYRCKKDGSYEEVQCQKYGVCWCVDEDGDEIPGTRSSSVIRCPRKGTAVTTCRRTYQDALRRDSMNRFVPWCRADGSYSPVQCFSSYCYCVNTNGQEISNTRTYIETGKPKCTHTSGYRKPCQEKYWKSVRSGQPSAYLPRCRRDGDYEPMQCNRQDCWCVEPQGAEINGTRTRGPAACPPPHRRPLDFGFLVDSAPDISDQEWQQILSYMHNVIDRLQEISSAPYGTRVGIVSYASVPYLHFDFNFLWGPNINKDRLRGLVNSIPRQRGSDRRIDSAVDFARTHLFSSKGGVRPGSQRILLLIMAGPQASGPSHVNISPAARRLQKEGVDMYSIGVGQRYKQDEVLATASYVDNVRPYGFSELPRRHFDPDYQVDLGFIVDASASASSDWNSIIGYAKAVASSFDISPDKTHVGMIVFSNSARIAFPFDADYTNAGVEKLIDSLEQGDKEEVRVDRALQLANEELFNSRNGARAGARRIVIVLSAGLWNAYYRQAWRSAAAHLRGRGVDLYVAGILPQDATSFFRDLPWTSSKVFEASAEADPGNAAQEYLTHKACGNCFQECFLPGDGIEQIDICADECECGRKRSIKSYSDSAYMADPAECGESECFQNCHEEGDSDEQIRICSHECQCTF